MNKKQIAIYVTENLQLAVAINVEMRYNAMESEKQH